MQIVFRRAAEKASDRLAAARRRQIVGRIDYRGLLSIDEAADTVTTELIRGRGDVHKR